MQDDLNPYLFLIWIFRFLFIALGIKFASCASNSVLHSKWEVYHI